MEKLLNRFNNNLRAMEGIIQTKKGNYYLRGKVIVKHKDHSISFQFEHNEIDIPIIDIKKIEECEPVCYLKIETSTYDLELKELHRDYNIKKDLVYKQFIKALYQSYHQNKGIMLYLFIGDNSGYNILNLEMLTIDKDHISGEGENTNFKISLDSIKYISYIYDEIACYTLHADQCDFQFCFFEIGLPQSHWL